MKVVVAFEIIHTRGAACINLLLEPSIKASNEISIRIKGMQEIRNMRELYIGCSEYCPCLWLTDKKFTYRGQNGV
jgi:hypothetical protein